MKVIYSWRYKKIQKPKKSLIRQFIRFAADSAGLKIPPESYLAVYFLEDSQMIQMNVDFLGHDYLTDVICFNYLQSNECINEDFNQEAAVEIFISPGIALKRTADKEINNDYSTELSLYIIHGILHAAGFNDKKNGEKLIMYKKQDEILKTASNYFTFQKLFPLN
jgi:rRNA maturation RNase YbeY